MQPVYQSRFDRELRSRSKMAFYPTNPIEVKKIARMFDFGDDELTILEPCVGDAVAVEAFCETDDSKKRENVSIFAVELDEHRYDDYIKQNSNIDYSICGDFLSVECTKKSFSLVFCNPPYGKDMDGGRLENEFLKKITRYIGQSGYLVWIVPVQLIRDFEISRKLISNRFKVLSMHKFCEPEYSKFHQVAMILTPKSGLDDSKVILAELDAMVRDLDSIKTLDDVEDNIYKLASKRSEDIKIFRAKTLDEEAAIARLGESNLQKVLKEGLAVKEYGAIQYDPPLMPNSDQLFTMVAVGRAEIKQVGNGILQRGVVKEYEHVEVKGEKNNVKQVVTTFSKAMISIIEPTGNIIRLKE